MTLRRMYWIRSPTLAVFFWGEASGWILIGGLFGGTATKQIQTVPNHILKLRARLAKFNYIELNILIYILIFL